MKKPGISNVINSVIHGSLVKSIDAKDNVVILKKEYQTLTVTIYAYLNVKRLYSVVYMFAMISVILILVSLVEYIHENHFIVLVE